MRLPNLSAGAARSNLVNTDGAAGPGLGVEPSLRCGQPCGSSTQCPMDCPTCVCRNGACGCGIILP